MTQQTIHLETADLESTLHFSEMDLRKQLVRFSRWVHCLGYTPGTAGNLSVRLDEHLILATPTGCSKGLLRSADMVVIDTDGHKLTGARNVTSEIGMHLAVYRMRPDIEAIVHTHPPIATAFAACGKALDQPICSEILMTTGLVPLAPYATTGTEEVSASLEPFIPEHDAILLANHGLLTYGSSLTDAFMKTETVEHFAQVCLSAHQLGGAMPLRDVDIEKLHRARARYKLNASKGPACR
ncbi:MAG TPA: class II aldolase/adducin family protein [Edaphobacter sp.]